MPELTGDDALIAELYDTAFTRIRALIAKNPRTIDPLDDEYIQGSLSGAPEAATAALEQFKMTRDEENALIADIYADALRLSRRAQNVRRLTAAAKRLAEFIPEIAKLAVAL